MAGASETMALEYQPASKQAGRRRLSVVVNRLVAIGVTLILLLVLPEIAIVMLVAIFGIGASLLKIAAGITMAVVHRAFGLRRWVPPLIVAGIAVVASGCVSAFRGCAAGTRSKSV